MAASDSEQPLVGSQKFEQMYDKAWERGEGYIAEQVMSMDINNAAKINILHIRMLIFRKTKTIHWYRRITTALFVLQATTGAIVPILIPFGQTYEGKTRVIFGQTIPNLGEALLVMAVVCSLIGSISMVVERAGKFSKLAYAYNNEQEKKINELDRFLALGGKYKTFNSHKEAYPVFIDEMCVIFDANSRAKIYGGSAVDSHEENHKNGEQAATSLQAK